MIVVIKFMARSEMQHVVQFNTGRSLEKARGVSIPRGGEPCSVVVFGLPSVGKRGWSDVTCWHTKKNLG